MSERTGLEPEREAALRLLTENRPHEALERFARALANEPRDPALLNGTGAALALLGQMDRALRCYEEALAIDPEYAPAVRNFVQALASREDPKSIPGMLLAMRARGQDSVELRVALARAHHDAGAQIAAIDELETLVARVPSEPRGWALLGWFLIEAGEMERGRSILETGYEQHPLDPLLGRILADVEPSRLHEASLHHFARVAAGSGSVTDRIEAHLALARRALTEARYDDAWRHFSNGNALRRGLEAFDEAATLASMLEIERVFDAAFFEGPIEANLTDWPVFIFGMPRSGTSLVEQMLGVHPQVYAAGELSLLDHIVSEEVRTKGAISSAIGYRYGYALNELAPPLTSHVTDKMPGNFRYAGLIARYLPCAKMIHVVRDALDTCVSCFTTNFAGGGLVWTLDVDELAHYYLAYERLMRHWNEVLPPGRMLEVRYEELVAEPAAQIRRILDFIGLPWNDACLRFNESKRTVLTASAAQVRKPIYASSIGVAERYGDAIAPLRAALGR